MDTITHSPDKIEFSSRLSPLTRLIFFLFGLFPLLAPYELLIKPAWNGTFSLVMLFMLLISLGAIGVSIFFITAALFGRSQRFEFAAPNRLLRYHYKTAFNPLWAEPYDFSHIETIDLAVSTWDSGPDTYDIRLKIRGQREMKFGNFPSQSEAEKYVATLRQMCWGS